MKKMSVVLTIFALVFLIGAKNDKCGDFLRDLGFEFSDEMVTEFVIPSEFDAVYASYNELQKESGFDLLPYAGKECEMHTYELLNHPFGKCRANLIVFEGRIIGGDISSVELDGFMEPLIGAWKFRISDSAFSRETERKNAFFSNKSELKKRVLRFAGSESQQIDSIRLRGIKRKVVDFKSTFAGAHIGMRSALAFDDYVFVARENFALQLDFEVILCDLKSLLPTRSALQEKRQKPL